MAKAQDAEGAALLTPTQAITQLKSRLADGKLFPELLLYTGEEPYYFEQIEALIAKTYRDTASYLYGNDCTYSDIALDIQSASLFVTERVVVVKEAESVKDLDKLIPTILRMPQGTSLVLVYQGDMAYNAKKLFGAFRALPGAQTMIVVSPRITSRRTILSIVSRAAKEHNVEITDEAAEKLLERVGFNAVTITKEIAKLAVIAAQSGRIEANMVEFLVGESLHYTTDDFCQALYKKQRREALSIAQYMTKSPTDYPLPLIVATLYAFFSNLMVAAYQRDRSEKSIASALNLKNAYQAQRYSAALWLFKPMQIFNIVHELRLADARLKGAEEGDYEYESILFSLVYLILS